MPVPPPLSQVELPAAPIQPGPIVPAQAFTDGNGLPVGSTPMAMPQGKLPTVSVPTANNSQELAEPERYTNRQSEALHAPVMSNVNMNLPERPQPTQLTKVKVDKYIERLLDPESTLDVISAQTRVLVLKRAPFRVQVGDEKVVSCTLSSSQELLLHGNEIGATVLNLWFGDKDDPSGQETLTYLVRVFPDPQAKERLEEAYKALENELNDYFQDTSIRLKVLGDKLVVSGRVRDYVQGQQVLRILRANMGGEERAAKIDLLPAGGGGKGGAGGAGGGAGLEAFQAAGGPNIINLLEVAGEQQVMLRVIVAEVNRAAARSIGLNFSIRNQQGVTVFSNRASPLLGSGGAGLKGVGGLGFRSGAVANLYGTFDAGRVPFAMHALRTMQYAKSLAEPTLVTMNGTPANFLAGGQFPVPVISGLGAMGGLQGVSYVPYGVQLNFTPFITDRDRIRLQVNASVSARDMDAGANIGGANVAGLNSRNVNTTVELRQGETLAVAGLIESNNGGMTNRVPLLGDLPFFGPLTGVTQHQASEKELVIFITPELARPIDPEQVVRLPGCEILDPNDLEFYVLGRIEGHCHDYRSPIRTDSGRIRMYQEVEQANVFGPSGYTPLQP